MMKRLPVLLWIALFCFLPGMALAGVDYPPELAAHFPRYVDSEVVQVMKLEGNMIVSLKSKHAVGEVFRFYKTTAEKGGWKIGLEAQQETGMMLMAEKGPEKAVIALSQEDGETAISITLSKE